MLLLVLALTGLLLAQALAPERARAATLVVPGPVEALAGGSGRLVWAHRDGDAITLQTRTPAGVRALPAAPLRSIASLDVGTDRRNRPTAVYVGCRQVCGVFRLPLDGGAERPVTLPPAPAHCRHDGAAIDGALYVRRSSSRRRCRSAGVYRLRGSRVQRVVGGRVFSFDVDRGRVAFERHVYGFVASVHVLRLGERRSRRVASDYGGSFGYRVWFWPQWSGSRLWMGISVFGERGHHALVSRCRLRPRRCEQAEWDAPRDAGIADWAFAGGRVFGVHDDSERSLIRWSDPPPDWRPDR